MSKLPKNLAAKAANAEDKPELHPWKPGRYVCTLSKVEEETSEKSGNDYWKLWLVADKDYHRAKDVPGVAWDNVTLIESLDWKQKQFFNSFGYDVDSDYDEILDDPDARCVVVVGAPRENKKDGVGTGVYNTNVVRLSPFDPDEWEKLPPEDDTF